MISINPVGAEVRVELAPVGWQSQELWEAKLSHRSLSEKRLSRGDQVFATPQVGYFFASEGKVARASYAGHSWLRVV